MTENLKDDKLLISSSDSKKVDIDIQAKKKRLLEIEKEEDTLNKDLNNILEKIADAKVKLADKVESLSEEAFINLSAKNKVYTDLLKHKEKIKLSNKPELEEIDSKLVEAEREINKAKEKNDELNNAAGKFRMDANIALEKALKYSDKLGENL